MDLGESDHLASDYWQGNQAYLQPSNLSNNLLSVIKQDYPGARNINTVTQALSPLNAYGISGGIDYEKVESARLLSSSEYTLNSTLGYISLKSALAADEVLGVAYEYTYNGKVYQVGEFSADITSTDQSLYLKMLKSTTVAPKLPMWDPHDEKCLFAWHYDGPEAELQAQYKVSERHDRDRDKLSACTVDFKRSAASGHES